MIKNRLTRKVYTSNNYAKEYLSGHSPACDGKKKYVKSEIFIPDENGNKMSVREIKQKEYGICWCEWIGIKSKYLTTY